MAALGILHFSDIHIARDINNQNLTSIWFLRRSNGHALSLARAFAWSIDDVSAHLSLPPSELRFVMSGDATSTGDEQEFANAHTFMKAGWHRTCLGSQNVGLDADVSRMPQLVKVPGNHDQWQGRGYPGAVAYSPGVKQGQMHFEPTPWRHTWFDDDLCVEIFGIDTNSGLSSHFPSWLQTGAVDPAELGQLETMLSSITGASQTNVKRVPVLVMHHSLIHGRALSTDSADEICRLAEKYGIAAILTGHTHDFGAGTLTKSDGTSLATVEFRAASALQGPDTRNTPAPGFLAHRLERRNDVVHWTASRFIWNFQLQQFEVFGDPTRPFFEFDFRC